MQLLTATATRTQLGSVLQHDQTLSFEQGLKFFNPVKIDDSRTVDAKEFFRRKVFLKLADASSQKVTLFAHVKIQVVACRLDPIDFSNLQKNEAARGFHRQA